MPPLSVLMKPSSSLCNMTCDYCFYCDESNKRMQKSYGLMTEQTLKNIIRRTLPHAEGSIQYAFQGGEPTLRGLEFYKKAVSFQQQYNKQQIQVSNAFQTNGYLLDEEWCRFFKEQHFLVGLSVDGTEEIHNSLRHDAADRGPTYDRILHSAALMDAWQVDYNILTVVTPAVAGQIRQIYQFYRKKRWRYQQYIACLEPLNEGHGQQSYALLPEQYGQFLIDLFNLWYRDLQTGTQPYIRQFENFIALSAGYSAESCDQRGICSIQYVAEADGSIYPCDFYMLDEYRLGNLNTDRLPAIDMRRKEIDFIEQSQKISPKCRQCDYYQLCRCGCRRSRELCPDTDLYLNYFCPGYRMFFEACHEQIMEIGKRVSSHNI